jgi:hypothetical protein
MNRNDRRMTLGTLALAVAMAGAATDSLESPAATHHAELAAALDRLDVTAGGPALGLAIKSQGNRALLDIRSETAVFGVALPSVAHASTKTAAPASTPAEPAE